MARRSNVALLSDEVRAWLNRELIKRGFSGYEELERLILEAHGEKVSKSAIHRYGQKLARKLDAVRASTQAAAAIAQAAPDDADLRSSAVMSLVQTDIFNVLLMLQEADDADPAERLKLLSRAAASIADLSRASVNQKKWQTEWREKIGARLGTLESDARSGKRKLDAETLRQVREEVYGVI